MRLQLIWFIVFFANSNKIKFFTYFIVSLFSTNRKLFSKTNEEKDNICHLE